jgi:hypothetical protein
MFRRTPSLVPYLKLMNSFNITTPRFLHYIILAPMPKSPKGPSLIVHDHFYVQTLIFPRCATHRTYIFIHVSITCEGCTLRNSSCTLLRPPVSSSLLGPNTHLNNPGLKHLQSMSSALDNRPRTTSIRKQI